MRPPVNPLDAQAAQARERQRGLAAAIAAITVAGVALGLSFPLLAFVMERMGVSPGVMGLNAAVPAVAMLAFSGAIPGLIARVGQREFLGLCLAIAAGGLIAFKLFEDIWLWFPIRLFFACGVVGLFVASETWINALADDDRRGRIIGVYAAVMSVGFAAGPIILSLVGSAGWAPFLIGVAVLIAAGLPVLAAPKPPIGGGEGRERETAFVSPLAFLRESPTPMLAAATFGMIDAGLLQFLSIYGLHSGLDEAEATRALAALVIGGAVLIYPINALADRFDARLVLFGCAVCTTLFATLLPVAVGATWSLYGALFMWGGVMYALYTLALTMIGARYQGAQLVRASAAITAMYGLGSLVGPVLSGAMMEWWDPHGLIVALGLMSGFYVVVAAFRLRAARPRLP